MKIGKRQAERLGLIPKLEQHGGRRPLGRNQFFDALCKANGLPLPLVEVQFCPGRKWRFDFLWGKIALEVQGGIFTQGRHVRGPALLKEFEKLNEAAVLGYRVLFCTPADLKSGAACALVKRALEGGCA